MRPSVTSLPIAWRATSRRTGLKLLMVTASGVSSTTTSTPVANSKARMLRPLRPMMRPFMSSEGRGTTLTEISLTCSLARRCTASEMMLRARVSASSCALASTWRITRAMSLRVSCSTAASNSSRASSCVMRAIRSSSVMRSSSNCCNWFSRLSSRLWRLFRLSSRCSSLSMRVSSCARRCCRRSPSRSSSRRRRLAVCSESSSNTRAFSVAAARVLAASFSAASRVARFCASARLRQLSTCAF